MGGGTPAPADLARASPQGLLSHAGTSSLTPECILVSGGRTSGPFRCTPPPHPRGSRWGLVPHSIAPPLPSTLCLSNPRSITRLTRSQWKKWTAWPGNLTVWSSGEAKQSQSAEQSQSVWPLRSLRQKAVLGLLVTWARSYADQAGTVGDVGWALVQETEGLRPPRSRVRVVRASWLST